eukprot:jgi/Botrbrau1/21382/Bobra.0216s0004.1
MFDPIKEIQGKLKQVETADVDNMDAPLAHADFFDEELQFGLNKLVSKVAIRGHLKHEFLVYMLGCSVYFSSAYLYDAFAAYFDRDNVGMPGTSCFFKIAALTDRNYAYLVIDHLNKRGGRAILAPLTAPPIEPEGKQTSTLNAFELALALVKDRFQRIRLICPVAEKNNDKDTVYFLQRIMEEESNKIRKYAHNVAKLRKLGSDESGLMFFDERCPEKCQDQAIAAAVEAIVPCKLYEGTMSRERKRQSAAVEDNFFAEDGRHRKALIRASE